MIARITCLLAVSLGLAACGAFSRQALVFERLAEARELDDVVEREAELAELRGLAPTWALPWLESAITNPDGTRSLALIERGLAFDPANPELHLERVRQLARRGDLDAQLAAVDEALRSSPWTAPVEGLLREIRIEALLARGDVEAAAHELVVLAGLSSTTPRRLATGWAQIALVAAVQGDLPRADEAFDRSLDQGADGVGVLRAESLRQPQIAQASALIIERAAERHLDHPDLLIYRIVDLMLAGDVERAEAELSVLPQPLPARLVAPVEMIGARLDIAAGRIDAGLATLAERLDRDPADPDALNLLVASHVGIGRPPLDAVAARLERAIAATRSPAMRRDLGAMLEQLTASDEAAVDGDV